MQVCHLVTILSINAVATYTFNQALFLGYGVDWDGPPPADDDNAGEVVVPETNCPLSPTQLAELHALYDPFSPDDNFSVNLFLNVLQFVENNLIA